MSDEKIILTPEQALSMLSDDETIHTFRSTVGMMIGADWDREDLEREIMKKQCEIGGEGCQSMNHGLVIWTDNTSPLFVECRKDFDYAAFEKEVAGAAT